MFNRKSLFVALTVLMMLAMLVPVATAAPEDLTGVVIKAPTADAPAYVNPEGKNNSIAASIQFNIQPTQVDNVYWQAWLLQAYDVDTLGKKILTWGGTPTDYLKPADLPQTKTVDVKLVVDDAKALDNSGEVQDGWYSFRFCAADDSKFMINVHCDVTVNSVLVQDSAPSVDLESPGAEPEFGQGWVNITGKEYYLSGKAFDVWGVTKVEFQYCDGSNAPGCGLESSSWVTIATGAPVAGVKNYYAATWDSSSVTDDWGWIRMCATNHVGLTNCAGGPDENTPEDAHPVYINNRAYIHLEPGWNLISLPIMPYDTLIDHMLANLKIGNSVKWVQSYDANTKTWMMWDANGPDNLTDMTSGKGYWVFATAEDDLMVIGTWKAEGNTVPPEYPVYASWNLFGYTHWGTPTWYFNKTVNQYLSTNMAGFKAMWQFDALHRNYIQVTGNMSMDQGAGYWLALAQAGSVNP